MNYSTSSWIEINQTAFEHNLHQISAAIGSKQLALVVKGNAYGHGMHQIAQLCQENEHVAWLCTAFASEALALRQAGITKPILVLSYLDTPLERLITANLTLTVWERETALALSATAQTHNSTVKVHFKVDTGLARFGTAAQDAPAFFAWLKSLPGIHVTGIYTHCAHSTVTAPATYTQLAKFKQVLHAIDTTGLTVHVANSAAAWRTDIDEQLQHTTGMVRVGLSAYGYWPCSTIQALATTHNPSVHLVPIISWKTRIAAIQNIRQGALVGYNHTYRAPKDRRIALLPVGYADGYDARFSNAGIVMLADRAAPVVARVAMTCTTIDVTEAPGTPAQSIVTLLGSQPEINPECLTTRVGIPNVRELLTRINPQVPRSVIKKPLRCLRVPREKNTTHAL